MSLILGAGLFCGLQIRGYESLSSLDNFMSNKRLRVELFDMNSIAVTINRCKMSLFRSK